MEDKRKLSVQFAEKQTIMNDRHRTNDELIENALVGHHDSLNKRLKSSTTSSISTTVASSTPASARGVMAAPTPTSDTMDEGSPPAERGNGSDELADCTFDIREYFQPPLPFVFPSHLNDDSD